MNRLTLVRHGGSTGNENASFYSYNDSAICLTTNGIEQALSTAAALDDIDPTWLKPGNFNLEVFASEYTRAQQTCRICLDQMGLLSVAPRISPLLNERNYGTTYLPAMDSDPDCTANSSESSHQARARARGWLEMVDAIFPRADVLAFSHMGLIRALVAELLGYSDAQMMATKVDNGEAFLFLRTVAADGTASWAQQTLPAHVLAKDASFIQTVPDPGPPTKQP